MIWSEAQQNIDDVFKTINEALASKYTTNTKNKPGDYINSQQVPFSVRKLGDVSPWNCLTISYEDTGEDGDLYYPEDYDSFEEMLKAMIAEIDR